MENKTKEERELRIKKAKEKEVEEDKWVKDNGFVLERDTCDKCLEIRKKDERNYTGDRCFCSAGHSYEVSNIRKSINIKNAKNEIFEKIYQLGKEGIKAKENDKVKEVYSLLDNLELTWY